VNAPPPAPNVVFIIADQHRWDFVGYEDGVTVTPNLDALAARGAVFRGAHCTSPLCCPSRAAIASGRYGTSTGSFTNLHQLPPGTPGFVGQLRSAGYRTAAVGKTHMEIHAYDSDLTAEPHREFMDSLGWDEVCEVSGNGMLKTGIRCAYSEHLREAGRFDEVLEFYRRWHYFMDKGRGGDPGFHPHEWPLEPELQETEFIGRRAAEWLAAYAGAGPYFLHVGFAAPHSPVEPAPGFLDIYRDRDEPPPAACEAPPEHTAAGRRGYRAMISQIDHWVGEIARAVADRGELERTVFVYTADHGEMAGDHGRVGKCVFFDPSVRVPLVVAGPGVRGGTDSDALVEIIDLGATVNELCGVRAHELDQGRSLAPLLSGASDSHRETVYAEMGCDRMLYDGRHKLMWGDPASDTRELGRLHLDKPVDIPPSPARLYDMEADALEERDLADDGSSRHVLEEMKEKLLLRMNENTEARPFLGRGAYRPL